MTFDIASLELRWSVVALTFLWWILQGEINDENILGNIYFNAVSTNTRSLHLFYDVAHRPNYVMNMSIISTMMQLYDSGGANPDVDFFY